MRVLLLAMLMSTPAVGFACECDPGIAIFSPGGEVVGRRAVFFVDFRDLEIAKLSVEMEDGRAIPFASERYGANVLRVRLKRRLPSGDRLRVRVELSSPHQGEINFEAAFVVAKSMPLPPEGAPLIWRSRNTSFCGTTELIGAQWSDPVPGAYGLWLSNDDVLGADPPLTVAGAYVQAGESVINFQIESCWGDGAALPTPPWIDGASKVIIRRIQADGTLDAPLVLPLPAPPVETHSGIN